MNEDKIKELEKRIDNLEYHLFGFTKLTAKKYLDSMNFKQNTMTPEQFDNWCSLNLNTVSNAERCLGI